MEHSYLSLKMQHSDKTSWSTFATSTWNNYNNLKNIWNTYTIATWVVKLPPLVFYLCTLWPRQRHGCRHSQLRPHVARHYSPAPPLLPGAPTPSLRRASLAAAKGGSDGGQQAVAAAGQQASRDRRGTCAGAGGGERCWWEQAVVAAEQGRLQDLEARVRNTNGGPKIYEIVSNRNKACTFTK